MSVLDYAIRIIKATMKNHSNESFFPYFFIVGAGISVPEIPAAYEIIDECKDKSKKFDEISYIQFENEIKSCETNPMRCYSKWIEFAYPNRIDCIALLWYFAYIEKTIHSEVIVWNCF